MSPSERDVRDLERTHGVALLLGMVGGALLAFLIVACVTVLMFSLEARLP
jgi:hypothetical protein